MYKIAISNIALSGKIPAGDKRWGIFNDSFQNLELETIDIANAIYTGRSFTTWHNGRRSLENFTLGQHIGVDMDSGDKRSAIDTLAVNEFVRMYASLIYTTPSHTIERPRARILFLLDEPIEDAEAYKSAASFLCTLFDGADSACTDASRFFYGSLNCEIALPGNVLPMAHLRTYYKRYGKRIAVPEQENKTVYTPNDNAKPAQRQTEKHVEPAKLLEWAVKDAASEGRNKRAYRLGKQLKEGGYTYSEALPIVEIYQQQVDRMKREPFPQVEAVRALNSAFKQ